MTERDKEFERFDKIDYYLAQIACEVRQTHTDPRKRVWQINDLLLKFRSPSAKSNVSVQDKNELEKALWVGSLVGGFKALTRK